MSAAAPPNRSLGLNLADCVGASRLEISAGCASRSDPCMALNPWCSASTVEVGLLGCQRYAGVGSPPNAFLEADPIVLPVATRDGYDSPLTEAGLPELRLAALDAVAAMAVLNAVSPRLSVTCGTPFFGRLPATPWHSTSCRSERAERTRAQPPFPARSSPARLWPVAASRTSDHRAHHCGRLATRSTRLAVMRGCDALIARSGYSSTFLTAPSRRTCTGSIQSSESPPAVSSGPLSQASDFIRAGREQLAALDWQSASTQAS